MKVAKDLLKKYDISYEEVKQIIADAIRTDNVANLFQHPKMEECLKTDASSILRVATLLLLHIYEDSTHAIQYAVEAQRVDPENHQVWVIMALAMMRQAGYVITLA